jgi:hypothetical protein
LSKDETDMNDTFHCGSHETLVAYLYDECGPADRAAVAAHLAHCAACAEEIAALRATRTQLAAWAPPDARLGFQITSADQRNEPLAFVSPGRAVGPWWREPLPAWAQVAAAALIFAAGLTAGSIGRSPAPTTVATAPAPAPVAERAAQTAAASVSATELARLERRLSAIEAAPGARNDDQALLAQVRQLIEDSERRQSEASVRLVTNVAHQFEDQRVKDLQRVDDNLGFIRTVTGEEFRKRDGLDPYRRVSFLPPAAGR